MKAQDHRYSSHPADAPPQRDGNDRKQDEFQRFRAEKALTDKEKAALPASLRRLLGWE
jgi:hypothetical protein